MKESSVFISYTHWFNMKFVLFNSITYPYSFYQWCRRKSQIYNLTDISVPFSLSFGAQTQDLLQEDLAFLLNP